MFGTSVTEQKPTILSRAELDTLAPQYLTNYANSAVLIVNLLHFRIVNYALGHDLGDALLAEAEARLLRVLPAEVIAAPPFPQPRWKPGCTQHRIGHGRQSDQFITLTPKGKHHEQTIER